MKNDAVREAVETIAAAGIEDPRAEVELLVADALGTNGSTPDLDSELDLTPEQEQAILERVRRRAQREPIAYILGRCQFRQIEVAVDERVLIPRKETEQLVDTALDLPEGARVHEVGTGCGAIALALLNERPDLHVTASDISADAAEVARANAQRLKIDLEVIVEAGVPQAIRDESVDLMIANLPYLTEDSLQLRPKDLDYEPDVALAEGSGSDGLGVIRSVLSETPSGWRVALEHDNHHGATVRDMLVDAQTLTNYVGEQRITVGTAR